MHLAYGHTAARQMTIDLDTLLTPWSVVAFTGFMGVSFRQRQLDLVNARSSMWARPKPVRVAEAAQAITNDFRDWMHRRVGTNRTTAQCLQRRGCDAEGCTSGLWAQTSSSILRNPLLA